MSCSTRKRRATWLITLALPLLLWAGSSTAAGQRLRVAVVLDGAAGREVLSAAQIERQIANVAPTELHIVLQEDKHFVGDWTRSGADAALDRALQDPEVDIIVTLGVLSSNQAALRRELAKAVLAAATVDPALQNFPQRDGKSGMHNFAYVAPAIRVADQLKSFHDTVGFRHLTVLADEAYLNSLPGLRVLADQAAESLGVSVSIVASKPTVAATLQALPPQADAVYVAGLLRFSAADMRELATGLNAKKLPSFAALGRADVESGLLLTNGGVQRDADRLARRLVLMMQRIDRGEDAATFETTFPVEQRLTFNMQTARAIGFSPRWSDLADAELVAADPASAPTSISLVEAMRLALGANPSLLAGRARLDSSADDVAVARSNLLPQIDASFSRTRIDADHASPLTQAEVTSFGSVSGQVPLYSESAWSGYSISKSLLEAATQKQREETLDTLESTASAYLAVLRSKAVESVRRASAENTRKNLDIARARESIGLGGHSDYLRWVSQLARDKENLLEAESVRHRAETELARIMHLPSAEPFATVESGVNDPLAMVATPQARKFLDTPAAWSEFTEYVVQAARQQAPEIAQADSLITARRRTLTTAKRAFFVPNLALVSKGSDTLQRSGIGSTPAAGDANDRSWSVSLQVSLPLYTGGRHRAELSQARHELRAAEADRAAAQDSIEARTRSVLFEASSSYPSIGLSAQSASAAGENLAMVTDAYARGVVSVTDLIDAQDASLSADLAAADAKYGFLTDFVQIVRALGEFDILLDTAYRDAWLQRLHDWHSSRAVRSTSTAEKP